VKSILKGHHKYITGLAFSAQLNTLVSSGADAQVCLAMISIRILVVLFIVVLLYECMSFTLHF